MHTFVVNCGKACGKAYFGYPHLRYFMHILGITLVLWITNGYKVGLIHTPFHRVKTKSYRLKAKRLLIVDKWTTLCKTAFFRAFLAIFRPSSGETKVENPITFRGKRFEQINSPKVILLIHSINTTTKDINS
jgi:hypothetical protein